MEHNQKLSDDAIINLSGIEQDPTLSAIEVKRRLQSSGLFTRVRVSRTTDAMTISVDEKTTWFVLPYFTSDSTSRVYGVAAGKASVFGDNGNVLGRYQIGVGNHEANLLYSDEYFLDSQWAVSSSFDFENSLHHIYQDRVIVQSTRNAYYGFSPYLGYHLSPYFTLGLNHCLESHRFERPDRTTDAGLQLSHRLALDFGNFYVDEGLSRGKSMRVYFETSNPMSDFQFLKAGASGKLSIYLRDQLNWIMRPKAEAGSSLPYFQEFEIGGSRLRSFPSQSFRANSYGSVQNDFLLFSIPVWKLKVRPLTYVDWAFIQNSGRTGVGTGVQVFVNKVAIPAIQFLVGYGFNPNGFSALVAIGPQL